MSASNVVTSKHLKMTNEFYTEVIDVFKLLSDNFGSDYFPSRQLPTALKVLGLDVLSDVATVRSNQDEPIDLKEFVKIVADHIDSSQWCFNEMNEAFSIFDKDNNGFISPLDIKRVFTKINETLTGAEIEDQVNY